MAYQCDMGDENQAVVLVTNLDEGAVLALCPACFPNWVAATANALAEPADGAVGDTAAGSVEGSEPAATPGQGDPDGQPIDLVPVDPPPARPKRARQPALDAPL